MRSCPTLVKRVFRDILDLLTGLRSGSGLEAGGWPIVDTVSQA